MRTKTLLKVKQLKKCMKDPIHAINNYIRLTQMDQREIQTVLKVLNGDEPVELILSEKIYNSLAEALLYKMIFKSDIKIGFASRSDVDCNFFRRLLIKKFTEMKELFKPILVCQTKDRIELNNGSVLFFITIPTHYVGKRFDLLILDIFLDNNKAFKNGIICPQLYDKLIKIVEEIDE